MRVHDVSIGASPDTANAARLAAVLQARDGSEWRIWLDVPAAWRDALSTSGNPWLLAMLPMAAARDESIEIDLPVDPLLVENLRGVSQIWHGWYPDLAPVDIIVGAGDATPALTHGERVAAFFSGGVDSYFTVARWQRGGISDRDALDDLITVWGFDFDVHDAETFGPIAAMLREGADALGLTHAVVRTNLRDNNTPWRRRWGPLTHGAGLGFVALALERRFRRVMVASADPYQWLMPWGTHPLVDPLYSTQGMRLVYDGAAFTRLEKTRGIADFATALDHLHVCQPLATRNCGACEKCLRTMIALDLLNRRDASAGRFDWRGFGPDRIRRVYTGAKAVDNNYAQLATFARSIGRTAEADAIDAARRQSQWRRGALALAERLHKPVLWRLAGWISRAAARNVIGPQYTDFRRAPDP